MFARGSETSLASLEVLLIGFPAWQSEFGVSISQENSDAIWVVVHWRLLMRSIMNSQHAYLRVFGVDLVMLGIDFDRVLRIGATKQREACDEQRHSRHEVS